MEAEFKSILSVATIYEALTPTDLDAELETASCIRSLPHNKPRATQASTEDYPNLHKLRLILFSILNTAITIIMSRYLPLLTLVPTIFTFITIFLINFGGVGRLSSLQQAYLPEANAQFKILSWQLQTTPDQGQGAYQYNFYLNRLCAGSSGRTKMCQNLRSAGELRDRRQVSDPLINRLSPLNFTTVNLDAPFTFYVLSAITVSFLLVIAYVGRSPNLGRARYLGLLVSVASTFFILITSSVITGQMVSLRNQIRDNTTRTGTASSRGFGTQALGIIDYTISVDEVKLGSTVLVLTWAAVAAMVVESLMWAHSYSASRSRNVQRKEEGHIQNVDGTRV